MKERGTGGKRTKGEAGSTLSIGWRLGEGSFNWGVDQPKRGKRRGGKFGFFRRGCKEKGGGLKMRIRESGNCQESFLRKKKIPPRSFCEGLEACNQEGGKIPKGH